jgi:acyl-CoA thioester hydrolase
MSTCSRVLYSNKHVAARATPETRAAYSVWESLSTRWGDNDQYGHVNNIVYYSWFDTAVNAILIRQGLLSPTSGTGPIGLVVETGCHYFSPLSFPQPIDVGIRVAHIGTSSVKYELGIFAAGTDIIAAKGHFVHVYVDRESRRPSPLPSELRNFLQTMKMA